VTTPVERVKALMAKALSTSSEEEARTCALTAVRAIERDGIKLVSLSELERMEKILRTLTEFIERYG